MSPRQILSRRPDGFSVFSGEDNLTLPILALGGDGAISVVSNEVPMLMSRMVREALAGRLPDARKIHFRLLGLMNANFIETNPIPVKAAKRFTLVRPGTLFLTTTNLPKKACFDISPSWLMRSKYR